MRPVRKVLLMDFNIEDPPLAGKNRDSAPVLCYSSLFYQAGNQKPMFSVFVLMIIGALLFATIVAFLTGLLSYSFGIIVLSILFLAQILNLKQKQG